MPPKYKKTQLVAGDLVVVKSTHLGVRGLWIVEGVDEDGIHLTNANGNGEQVRTQEESDIVSLFRGVKPA